MAHGAAANGNGWTARVGVYIAIGMAVITVAGVFISIGNISNQVTQNATDPDVLAGKQPPAPPTT